VESYIILSILPLFIPSQTVQLLPSHSYKSAPGFIINPSHSKSSDLSRLKSCWSCQISLPSTPDKATPPVSRSMGQNTHNLFMVIVEKILATYRGFNTTSGNGDQPKKQTNTTSGLGYKPTTQTNKQANTTSGRALFDSCQGGYGDTCCPLVVDTLSWLALLAGIAVATFLLRNTIIANINGKRRRRRREGEKREDLLWRGRWAVDYYHIFFIQYYVQLLT
jgi:hypothetical protein